MGSTPQSTTASVAQRILASLWNTYVRDAIAFFDNPPRALVYQDTTGTSVADDGAWHPVTFNQESNTSAYGTAMAGFDTDGMHSNSTNPSHVTIQTPGTYTITGLIVFVSNATGNRLARVGINGTPFGPSNRVTALSGIQTPVQIQTLDVVLAAGDYVEAMALQNSGGSLLTSVASPAYSFLSVRWVAA